MSPKKKTLINTYLLFFIVLKDNSDARSSVNTTPYLFRIDKI
jgi:hypothetical protein